MTQRMCGEAVIDSLAALKHVFVPNKMIRNHLNIALENINLDNSFDEDDPDTIILIRLLT